MLHSIVYYSNAHVTTLGYNLESAYVKEAEIYASIMAFSY